MSHLPWFLNPPFIHSEMGLRIEERRKKTIYNGLWESSNEHGKSGRKPWALMIFQEISGDSAWIEVSLCKKHHGIQVSSEAVIPSASLMCHRSGGAEREEIYQHRAPSLYEGRVEKGLGCRRWAFPGELFGQRFAKWKSIGFSRNLF